MILSINNLIKEYGDNLILDDVSMQIYENEKVAVVGDNGTGKTTLLNMICSVDTDYTGNINTFNSKIGYLKQIHFTDDNKTILDEMNSAVQHIFDKEKKLNEMETSIHNLSGEELDKAVKQYDALRHEYKLLEGYSIRSKIRGILTGLGFNGNAQDKKINTLSGGEKTRVYLAKLLIKDLDLIVLDEPTNHLDLSGIEWLEKFISEYKGSVLIVSHDRYFLDKTCNKIVAIEDKKLESYKGNYTTYIKIHDELLNAQLKAYEKNAKIIKHNEEVIKTLKSFNREKSLKRANSREKMLEKIEVIKKPVIEKENSMRLMFNKSIESGKDVLKAVNLSKSFEKNLFNNINFEIKRGEHIAIMGDNGSGKTTLLKIINGLASPDTGYIELGKDVLISYYDQEHLNINQNITVFDEISNSYPDMNNTQIRNLLAAFSFKEDDVFKLNSMLSGGEKGRLSLAKLMLSGANFIILDEPTNHLDINSKSILENAIKNFDGTVLYVSHDRYFINTTADRILEMHESRVDNYIGNYDYYLEKKDIIRSINTTENNEEINNESKEKASLQSWKEYKKQQAQINKTKNLLTKCEEDIESIENEISKLDEELNNPEFSSNVSKLIEISNKKTSYENKLKDLYNTWEDLAQQMEEI